MQKAMFAAQTDIEIGDEVKMHPYINTWTVFDIRTIHYLRSGEVEFQFRLTSPEGDHPGWVGRRDFQYPIAGDPGGQ